MTVRILRGHCIDLLAGIESESVHAVVTDPPYHLTNSKKGGRGLASVNLDTPHGRSRITTGFMGMTWDGGTIAFDPATWREVMRTMKPGAHLVAFGGTRTYHRLACAIEDAGFEIRDQLAWVFGSGFPKGTDKAKIPEDWQGWNTARTTGLGEFDDKLCPRLPKYPSELKHRCWYFLPVKRLEDQRVGAERYATEDLQQKRYLGWRG